jgi:hypothetical protein
MDTKIIIFTLVNVFTIGLSIFVIVEGNALGYVTLAIAGLMVGDIANTAWKNMKPNDDDEV